MIQNEHQRRVTESQLEKMKQGLYKAQVEGEVPSAHPLLVKAYVAGLESVVQELEAELKEYRWRRRDGK